EFRARVGARSGGFSAATGRAPAFPCVPAAAEAIAALMSRCEAEPGLEFVLDLPARRITASDTSFPISMPDGAHRQLVEGSWDSTGELLAARDDIARTAKALPYFSGWRPGA